MIYIVRIYALKLAYINFKGGVNDFSVREQITLDDGPDPWRRAWPFLITPATIRARQIELVQWVGLKAEFKRLEVRD